jgi:hypothetical protein
MRIRVTFEHCYRYGRWVSNRAGERSGPWCIQWAWKPGIGTAFKTPLPQHRNFPTRKAAEVVRKAIRGVWGQDGLRPEEVLP